MNSGDRSTSNDVHVHAELAYFTHPQNSSHAARLNFITSLCGAAFNEKLLIREI
jgi:hypothetical protein